MSPVQIQVEFAEEINRREYEKIMATAIEKKLELTSLEKRLKIEKYPIIPDDEQKFQLKISPARLL